MIWALRDGIAGRAQPGERGLCPSCLEPVIAKCGTILIWHWAHLADRACSDAWSEESSWHLAWKQWALEQSWRVEVPMERDGVRHRADIVTPAGWVIELQHSSIDARQVAERERFYGSGLVWVWDMTEREGRFNFHDRDGWTGFRWKRPAWSLCAVRRPLFLDFGGWLLRVELARKPSWYGDYDVCVGRGWRGSRQLLAAAFGAAIAGEAPAGRGTT